LCVSMIVRYDANALLIVKSDGVVGSDNDQLFCNVGFT